MNSAGDQPPPVICPDCGHSNAPASGLAGSDSAGALPLVCSRCGHELQPESTAKAPASPFDDLFDEAGAPQWKEPLTIDGQVEAAQRVELTGEVPLEFPEEPDPLALEPTPDLQPLEGEEPGKFDFTDMAEAERSAALSESEKSPLTGSQRLPVESKAESPADEATVLSIDWPADELADEIPTETPPAEKLSPVFSTGFASPAEDDQPLRIEGLNDAGPPESMTAVRCRICETLIYIQREQLGQKVKCPECYSEVLAQETTPHRKFPGGFRQEPAEQVVLSIESNRKPPADEAEDEYRLSAPIERPKVEIPSHYGLESGEADLLSPQTQLPGPPRQTPGKPEAKSGGTGAGEAANDSRPGANAPERSGRWKADSPKGPEQPGAQHSTPSQPGKPKSALPKSALPPNPNSLPPYWQQRPVEPQAPPSDGSEGMQDLGLDDLLAAGTGLRRWGSRLIQDPRLWVAWGLATLGMGLGYWALGLVGNWLGDGEKLTLSAVVGAVFIGLPGLACYLFGAGLTAVTSALMFQLGARKQPRLSAWEGSSFADWAPAVGFVAFAFWLAVLPGALVGMLLAVLSGWPILVALFSSLSAVLLGPLLLASVCRSDSPFRVFDSRVLRQIQFENIDWLKFLPGSMVSLGLFYLGTLLLLIPGFFGAFAGAAGQVAGWVIFGSLTGLYCGLLVDKVNAEETK